MAWGTLTATAVPGIADLGQPVRVTAVCRDATGVTVDPATLTLTVNAPDSTVSTLPIGSWTRVAAGSYVYDVQPTLSGNYTVSIVTTVPNAGADTAFEALAGPDATAWQPSITDVASLLAQRTIDATGMPTGKFSATTVPTDSQVGVLLADIGGEIAATCGTIPPVLYADAALTAKLGTAALVEASFEGTSDVLANMLTVRYQQALVRLTAACAQVAKDGQVEPDQNVFSSVSTVGLRPRTSRGSWW